MSGAVLVAESRMWLLETLSAGGPPAATYPAQLMLA
jgi:hypothetical protein